MAVECADGEQKAVVGWVGVSSQCLYQAGHLARNDSSLPTSSQETKAKRLRVDGE